MRIRLSETDKNDIRLAAWVGFSLYILINAWVSEDAYITLRVLDNFFHGYGLRWNVGERVQAYTHPLWLLLHIPLELVVHNLFLVSIILSMLCTTAALYLTLHTVKKPLLITFACFFLPMLLSKAFMDFSTSGLENPLCYLLYAAFGYVMLKMRHHRHFWFYCSLSVALALFNRLDTFLLYAPVLIWLVKNHYREMNIRQIMAGAIPLVGWLLFSLFYYGFLFPNTKYAKLDTALDATRYISHGLEYARYMLLMDTVSALAIASSLAFIIPAIRGVASKWTRIGTLPVCMAMGVMLYVLYVINIGGDYMIGRFWSLPVFCALWLAYIFTPSDVNPKILWTAMALMLLTATNSPAMTSLRKYCPACKPELGRMMDAKYMFGGNKLVPNMLAFKLNMEAHHKFANWGSALKRNKKPPYAEKAYYIGMMGYYAGPNITLIDELALADPLLARLPVSDKQDFYIGHFRRAIPAGYIYAMQSGKLNRMDPSLAKYYEKLKLIISGDLLDPERLRTIVAFNLGVYDHWKKEYLNCTVW